LKFSFIGFDTKTVEVGNQSVINITMSEGTSDIDEVVVVGYGTVKKTDLTGSVGTISSDNLVAKGTATMMESLQGEIPGVSITQNNSRAGGGFEIQIRGVQSIKDKDDRTGPLFVVDGIVVSDIQMLNPADIERVDVLKDASSTAIYGSRASEGVVMVTTKSAKGQVKNTENQQYLMTDMLE
jgi:TonB-dependent SusC/RagA subfamily outer membrane receptor